MHEGDGSVSIERQLGDVVGTVRMAVAAIETLRETVEKLAERAAFRADLEAVKTDLHRQIEDLKNQNTETKRLADEKVEKLRTAHSATQKWIAMATGGLMVVTTLLTLFGPAIRAKFGG